MLAFLLVACSGKVDATPFDDAAIDSAAADSSSATADSADDASIDTGIDASTVETSAGETSAEVCVPKTCAGVGAECGSIDDGCGAIVACTDTCVAPKTCAGGGAADKCGCPKTVGSLTAHPTEVVQIGTGGSWTNESSAMLSDDMFADAVVPSGGSTAELWARQFAFSLPSGASVTGVTVRVERHHTGTPPVTDKSVRLYDGAALSLEHRSSSKWPYVDAVETYGGPTDTWGAVLDATHVANALFGARISAQSPESCTARVDAIEITVHYEIPTCAD
ncbi:MAG: hypothetical protein ACXVEE_38605 [Polyangiales bacterium]